MRVWRAQALKHAAQLNLEHADAELKSVQGEWVRLCAPDSAIAQGEKFELKCVAKAKTTEESPKPEDPEKEGK